jgi:hypothetical protein
VVLVLIALTATLVTPALVRSTDAADARAPIDRVIAGARETAVRRGETLALDVARDGRFQLVVAAGDSAPVATGIVGGTGRAVRLVITPLGLCFPDSPARAAYAAWDVAACRATTLANGPSAIEEAR